MNDGFLARRLAQFEEITAVELRPTNISKHALLYSTMSKPTPMERQDYVPFIPDPNAGRLERRSE